MITERHVYAVRDEVDWVSGGYDGMTFRKLISSVLIIQCEHLGWKPQIMTYDVS